MRGTGRLRTAAVGAGLALALLGAACANDGGDDGNAGAGGDPTGATGGSTGGSGGGGGYDYGSGGDGGSTGSSGSAGGGGVLTVTQVNYQFTPAKITVSQGDSITIKDTNPSTPHTFTVTGTDIDVANDPMESQDVTIDLAPGTYDVVCRFHEGQGMTGTLVVE